MKLKCNKCHKTLTQDLYMVPYKDRLSKRVWEKSTYIEKWEDASPNKWAILDHLLAHKGSSIICDTYTNRELLTTLGSIHNVTIEYMHPVKMKGG